MHLELFEFQEQFMISFFSMKTQFEKNWINK